MDDGSDGGGPLRALFADAEVRVVSRGERLHLAGEPLEHLHLLSRGWVGRARSTEAGDAAFTGIHIAGDIVGADGLVNAWVDDDLFALNDAAMRRLPVAAVREAAAGDARVTGALVTLLAGETRFLRQALFAVGRLSSSERLATFIVQTFLRLVAAGLVRPAERRFALPLTQSQLAGVTGVTAVHLNRVVQGLRREGCLELGGGFVRIDNMAALERAAGSGIRVR